MDEFTEPKEGFIDTHQQQILSEQAQGRLTNQINRMLAVSVDFHARIRDYGAVPHARCAVPRAAALSQLLMYNATHDDELQGDQSRDVG